MTVLAVELAAAVLVNHPEACDIEFLISRHGCNGFRLFIVISVLIVFRVFIFIISVFFTKVSGMVDTAATAVMRSSFCIIVSASLSW